MTKTELTVDRIRTFVAAKRIQAGDRIDFPLSTLEAEDAPMGVIPAPDDREACGIALDDAEPGEVVRVDLLGKQTFVCADCGAPKEVSAWERVDEYRCVKCQGFPAHPERSEEEALDVGLIPNKEAVVRGYHRALKLAGGEAVAARVDARMRGIVDERAAGLGLRRLGEGEIIQREDIVNKPYTDMFLPIYVVYATPPVEMPVDDTIGVYRQARTKNAPAGYRFLDSGELIKLGDQWRCWDKTHAGNDAQGDGPWWLYVGAMINRRVPQNRGKLEQFIRPLDPSYEPDLEHCPDEVSADVFERFAAIEMGEVMK